MNDPKINYIALLRGINVGGHTITMDKLREYFTDLGFNNVSSYIQSGNIFFYSKEQNKLVLKDKIEKQLLIKLGYKTVVCLRSVEEIEKLLKLNPFKDQILTDSIRFAVTFLSEPKKIDLSLPYFTPDKGYEVIGKTNNELFIVWHIKDGKISSQYNFLEKKIQVPTTTRFYHTLSKIFQAATKEQ